MTKPTIFEYVTALEAAGGRVVVQDGALFLGGPDAPSSFWDVLASWRLKMAHFDNLTAATIAFIVNRNGRSVAA